MSQIKKHPPESLAHIELLITITQSWFLSIRLQRHQAITGKKKGVKIWRLKYNAEEEGGKPQLFLYVSNWIGTYMKSCDFKWEQWKFLKSILRIQHE